MLGERRIAGHRRQTLERRSELRSPAGEPPRLNDIIWERPWKAELGDASLRLALACSASRAFGQRSGVDPSSSRARSPSSFATQLGPERRTGG